MTSHPEHRSTGSPSRRPAPPAEGSPDERALWWMENEADLTEAELDEELVKLLEAIHYKF